MTQGLVSEQPTRKPGPVVTKLVLAVDRFALDLAEHWLAYVGLVFGIFVFLPVAAPALMAAGATGPAEVIYGIYSFVCHQLPERSFFLFGHKTSYSLAELGRAYPFENVHELRAIIGNEAMGWKMAWSDRMVSLYGSLWAGGIAYALFRGRLPRLPVRVWALLALVPLGLDGGSHMINDAVAGISGAGFRDTNAWLAFLTGNIFPGSFYAGNALGSFNSWARLITGTLTGLTTIWFIYPFVDAAMREMGSSARTHSSTAYLEKQAQ